MTSIATTEPTSLRIGDTWQWRREDLSSDYPASSWTLKYHFRNASTYFDVTAAADGAYFAVEVAKAVTALKLAGEYTWVAVVSDATYRFEVDSGTITLLPDYATAAAYDGRSWAAKLLAAVEAELTTRGSSGQLDLVNAQLEGRGLTRDASGLIKLRSQLVGEVKREGAAAATAAGTGRNRLLVRFA